MRELKWDNSRLITGDIVTEVTRLKAAAGPEIQIQGSSRLIQALLPHNLIDMYRLWIFPLVIGNGKRLFDQGAIPAGMEMVDTRTSTTGVMMNTYQFSGAVQAGSLALKNTPDAEIERRLKITRETDAQT